MKLKFNKNEQGDIEVKIEINNNLITFNYIDMLNLLLKENKIEDSDYGNLDVEEQELLKHMLQKISKTVQEGLNTDVNNE